MDDLHKLKEILREVGPELVWRPINTPDNILLADGMGDTCDGLPVDLQQFDFREKTVIDVGCNFGHYAFIVRQAGAKHVTGIDIDKRIIDGCMILKRLFHINGVSFLVKDIAASDNIGTFDTGMMIDFIGKEMVQSGIFRKYLDALEKMSNREMIISIRPFYDIKKHLGGDFPGLREKYPGKYIGENSFATIDFVRDRFKNKWNMNIASRNQESGTIKKETLHFTSKQQR